MIVEKIYEDKNCKLIRVLLKFNIGPYRFPKFGVWSYLLQTRLGVIVFETGPLKNELKITNNSKTILKALEVHMPNQKIKEISFSHWHYDHSESAPELQELIRSKYDYIPPIRLHANELEQKKYLKFFNRSIKNVWSYDENYTLGDSIQDNESIDGTNFFYLLTPGHTSGCISLVNNKEKIAVSGWWNTGIRNPIVRFLQNNIIDECKEYPINLKDYKIFPYHTEI